MEIDKIKGWWLIKLLLTIVGKKCLNEMKKASKNGKKSSAECLKSTLLWAKDTVYGKEHKFAEILTAKTDDELFELYQKNVPISNYEDFSPYIERHKNGEANILFPGKPKLYATTSGTTKEPKWIPVTEQYYQMVYKKMNQGWFYTMIMNRPKVFYGTTVIIVGKAIEGAAPDGTVYGSISGVMSRDIPDFMKSIYYVPVEVNYIADYKARYYCIMRFGIEKDVTLLLTANPSTLVEMQTNINEYFNDYCNDIEKGTISCKFNIPDDIRKTLTEFAKPNPRRAAELRKLKERFGTVLPKHYWPNLQVINTWFCGNTKIYYDKVRDSFPPDAVFHEFSYVSTECKGGLVLKSNAQETTLFGHKIYFEFIHESEIDNPKPKILQINELMEGQRYCLLATTNSGLYRYNMNDLVEVSSHVNDFPQIKFIQKVNGTISLTGEKLHERQFIEAVHETEKKTGKIAPFFVGFADPQKSNYKFYYEFADQSISVTEAEEFTAQLDKCMQEYNPEYREKRQSNRVKTPETALLGPESFERFKAACIDRGYRDGQFKLNLLMQDEKRHAMFKELVK